jgi:hypothetical protein
MASISLTYTIGFFGAVRKLPTDGIPQYKQLGHEYLTLGHL